MAVVFVDNGTFIFTDHVLGIAGGGPTASGFYMGWGTGGGTSTATNTDVDLGNPATEARVSATVEQEDGTASDTAQFIGRLTKTAVPKTINEFGFYIDATGTATDMIVRADHGDVTLATDDQIEYTLTIQMV